MSIYDTPHMYQTPTPPIKKKPVWKRVLPYAVIGIVGIGLGAAAGGDSPATEAAPAVETTVTASPEPAPTVTVSAEAEAATAPDECISALSDAEAFRSITQDFTSLMVEHMGEDGALFDALAVDMNDDSAFGRYTVHQKDMNERVKSFTDRVAAVDFDANAAACRSAGK